MSTQDFILKPLLPSGDTWADRTAFERGLVHGAAFPEIPPPRTPEETELSEYINRNYYDQALCQYANFYRTGDERFLLLARKVADSWWRVAHIDEGRTPPDSSLAPRNVSLAGLMLRALDGRPDMWDWITRYVREHFFVWVERPTAWFKALTDDQLAGRAPRQEGDRMVQEPAGYYMGVRDAGYMMLHAANLAAVHEAEAVRAEFKAKVLDTGLNYYGRLQRIQGDGGLYFYLREFGLEGLTTQPFQVGLWAEGMIAAHRLTGDERLIPIITKSAEHQYTRCFNPAGWKAMYYFVGGRFTDTNHPCDSGCGMASNPYPPPNPGDIEEARQLNPTAIHHFGYAYLLTGDERFKRWGREIFDASFRVSDSHGCLAWASEKQYNEAFRSAFKFEAYVESRERGIPLPPPLPSPDLPLPGPTTPPTGGGGTPTVELHVAGKVTRAGQPVAGVPVEMADMGGDAISATTTRTDGSFSFEVNANQKGLVRVAGFLPPSIPFEGAKSDLLFTAEATPAPPPAPVPDPPPTPEPPPSPPPTPAKAARVVIYDMNGVSITRIWLAKKAKSQLAAKVFDQYGKEFKAAVLWSSSQPSVATVTSAGGLVTAKSKPGAAYIYASLATDLSLKSDRVAVEVK